MTAKIKSLPYREGTWFALRLKDGGYAVGRVARMSGSGLIIAYFFGPRRNSVPPLQEVAELRPNSAIAVRQIGDLAILEGRWTVIGDEGDWVRDDWPIPKFIRKEELRRIAWIVEYADDEPNRLVRETPVPYETDGYPPDAALGSGAAEVRITRLISESEQSS